MPSYVGSKRRVSKDIYKAIKSKVPEGKFNFYDVFCGGLYVSYEFLDDYDVYASDYNEDLIYLYNYVRDNELPSECPNISKEQYAIYKASNELSFEKCFAVFYCTYMNIYKGAYGINKYFDSRPERNRFQHIHDSRFSTIKKEQDKIRKIKSVTLKDYREYDFSAGGNIIYCDPPYEGSFNTYKSEFDTDEFWRIVKKWKDEGNHVFVSEIKCPINHEVLFEKPLKALSQKTKFCDKLFYIL